MPNTLRYAIYARKSSEEDERQAESLPGQVNALKGFAAERGIEIIEVLEEARSAKEPSTRPVFASLIEKLKAGQVDGILCWSIDRLSRNPVDSGLISWLLQQEIIMSIRTMTREYVPEDNAVIMAVETSVANQYIRDLSRNVKRGMSRKAEQGWWPGLAPPGYRNDKETRTIAIDKPRFEMLRRAWEMLLCGNYSASYVLQELNRWGFTVEGRHERTKPLCRSAFYRLLSNPFYTGEFMYKSEIRKGNHQPMVSRYEFDLVQQLLGRPTRLRSVKSCFAYSGLIRCGACGCLITAERKTKVYRRTERIRSYIYYHCTGAKGCRREGVTESYLDQQIGALLQSCSLQAEVAEIIREVIDDCLTAEIRLGQTLEPNRQGNLRQQHVRLEALLEMRLAGELSADEYVAEKNRQLTAIRNLEGSLRRCRELSDRLKEEFRQSVLAVTDISARFAIAPPEEKRMTANALAHAYFLTLGSFQYRLHPIIELFCTFELAKKSRQQVESELAVPDCRFRWAVRNVIRTLMTGHDNCFEESTKFATDDKLPKTGINR